MIKRLGSYSILAMVLLFSVATVRAQIGNSGSIAGVVKDPSGGVVAGATVAISDPVSGYSRQTTTGSDGAFRFTNVPFNGYHITVTANGFAPLAQDVEVRSVVPTSVEIGLKIGTAEQSVTVSANGGRPGRDRVDVSHGRGPRDH